MRFPLSCAAVVTLVVPLVASLAHASPDSAPASAPAADPANDATKPLDEREPPFGWGDFTWLNGSSRQHDALLDSKYVTGELLLDVNYSYSNHHPIDNTVVGSTSVARNNEMSLSFVGLGGDFHAGHSHARLMTQAGMRSFTIPHSDGSTTRGQFDLLGALRYVTEAYGGYHWNALHGINLDVGIFASYIGLFSYYNFENWSYQPSFMADNTPWFFNGARLQVFPTDRLKLELWLVNGWQSYGKLNDLPGIGYQVLWRPEEAVSLVTNGYVGTDAQDQPHRVRLHSDSSVLVRYYNNPAGVVRRAAFAITADVGAETGGGVTPAGGSGMAGSCTAATPCTQNFVGAMAYHRLWFDHDHFGWTIGGGAIHNPGRYLVLVPPGVAAQTFDARPGTQFDAWDASTTLQYMPDELQTWAVEVVHRAANVPYFAGRGGVTSSDGFTTTPNAGFVPDLVKSETRVVLAFLLHI